jgi:hypothetical protein
MRRFLIRCYPARWLERYGDEFAVLLEERPLGPFDVADILLGALDARLRFRGRRAPNHHGRGFTMTLRIGGIAAVLGAGLIAAAALSTFGPATESYATALAVAGGLVLLVALVGVSAFQSRTHPRLVWTAFTLCAGGTIILLVGGLGLVGFVDLSGPWESLAGLGYVLGVVAAVVGFALFGVATFRANALSRVGALLIAISPLMWLVACVVSLSDWDLGARVVFAGLCAFVVGWFLVGIRAIRLDQPATDARPA